MGFWSSIGSAISSVVSSACSFVSSAISSVSSFVASVGSAIGGALGTVADVIGSIAQALGFSPQNERPIDLGDRALQAAEAGIQPENFDTFDEYLAEIRNFEIDPEKSKNISTEAKQLAGLAVTAKGIEEKFDLRDGTMATLSVMTAINPDYFTDDRIVSWFNGNMSVEDIIDYFDSKLDAAETIEVEAELINQDKEVTGRSETEIENELNQIREGVERGKADSV